MMSLKAFAPLLAVRLSTTPAAMYERQRALIRARVLPPPIGRGRGNGLPATAETVALMIIAVMATDNLSDTDDRVLKLAEAKFDASYREGGCMLTGAPNFKTALAAILRTTELAASVRSISVSRNQLSAEIFFERGARRGKGISRFGGNQHQIDLEIEAKISGGALMWISRKLLLDETPG
jgi:hypothetical protein